MLYRGIEYDIKVGIGVKQWIWIVHTPKPRRGDAIGSRQQAIYRAEKAIDTFCARNPEQCAARPTAA